MRKPNPTAVSFDSSTSTSRPRRASRVTIPATKPPSRMSSPRVLASATSPSIRTMSTRIAAWLLASSVPSSSFHPLSAERTETTATIVANAMKPSRTIAS